MPSVLDARQVVEPLVGKTILTPTESRPNHILAIKDTRVSVATEISPEGEPVALAKIQEGLDLLAAKGEVRISPETFGNYRRSSAIGAILATLPGVEVTESPTYVRMGADTPLRDQMSQACELIAAAEHQSETVVKDDPLRQMMSHQLPATVREIVANEVGYKVSGSAGQMNFLWAETPWLAIFDRLITESAQRGYYVVYLFHPRGERVFLSLNQAVTEARGNAGSNFHDQLRARATEFRGYLTEPNRRGLLLQPIDLNAKGDRSRGYESANVAAISYEAGEIPHDTVLISDLRRFLRLYEQVSSGLAEAEPMSGPADDISVKPGLESRRYGWHLRAEGRNSTIAKRAKQIQGSRCQVCLRDFPEEHGELGNACTEAHHLTPFKEMDSRPRQLDPAKDFAIVCSNCHRMLHSKTPPLSIAALAEQLGIKPIEP